MDHNKERNAEEYKVDEKEEELTKGNTMEVDPSKEKGKSPGSYSSNNISSNSIKSKEEDNSIQRMNEIEEFKKVAESIVETRRHEDNADKGDLRDIKKPKEGNVEEELIEIYMQGDASPRGMHNAPNINEFTEIKIQHRMETEKEEDIEGNIDKISKEGDLSPRQTEELKRRNKKGSKRAPQINTRSRKGSNLTSDQ
ncbi:hypothetical protein KY284_007911 [Solanum tuberosum]|nr:hypothetical protein KY284_007911 [Solanum tuberosum]